MPLGGSLLLASAVFQLLAATAAAAQAVVKARVITETGVAGAKARAIPERVERAEGATVGPRVALRAVVRAGVATVVEATAAVKVVEETVAVKVVAETVDEQARTRQSARGR